MQAVRTKADKTLVRWIRPSEEDGEVFLPDEEEVVDVSLSSPEEIDAAVRMPDGSPPANIVIEDDGSVTGVAPGPQNLEIVTTVLAMLKYAKSQNKKSTDPITYGDLMAVGELIRGRQISLEDDGTV